MFRANDDPMEVELAEGPGNWSPAEISAFKAADVWGEDQGKMALSIGKV